MKVQWVIQSNFLKDDNINKLASFLEVLNIPWKQIQVVPFSDEDIHMEIEENVSYVFYGSVGLVKKVAKQKEKFKPGVWFDSEKFAFNALKNGYGENLLNWDSIVIPLKDIPQSVDWDSSSVKFIRPVEDSKSITGGLFSKTQIEELLYGLNEVDPRNVLQKHTLMQVATPKNIVKETRNFIVNGKICTSSNYGHGKLREDPTEEDLDFVTEMIKLYQPSEVFTLDTCILEDGTKKVVETNCFNSSGFYWADVYVLAKTITEFLTNNGVS